MLISSLSRVPCVDNEIGYALGKRLLSTLMAPAEEAELAFQHVYQMGSGRPSSHELR